MDNYCPTAQGSTTGYEPEWKDENGEWKTVPTIIVKYPHKGIPKPLWHGGILETLGLFGWEEANALAWVFAAEHAAAGKCVEVRIIMYEIAYDLKAKRVDANGLVRHEP